MRRIAHYPGVTSSNGTIFVHFTEFDTYIGSAGISFTTDQPTADADP